MKLLGYFEIASLLSSNNSCHNAFFLQYSKNPAKTVNFKFNTVTLKNHAINLKTILLFLLYTLNYSVFKFLFP